MTEPALYHFVSFIIINRFKSIKNNIQITMDLKTIEFPLITSAKSEHGSNSMTI